jgi:hypothetical protein
MTAGRWHTAEEKPMATDTTVRATTQARLPGRAGGYPTGPPTVPYVSDELLRFLGPQSLGPPVAHHGAALQDRFDVVDDLGCRQDVGLQPPLELLPADRTLATATTPPGAPRLLRSATDLRQPTEVPSDTSVPEVPPQLQAEPLVRVFPRGVTMDATPPPPRLLGATEPLPGCPAFAHPKPPARLRPVLGQSQKIACAGPIGRRLAGVRFPERDHRRFRRMPGQANAGKPLRQHGPNLPGLWFQLAATDTVISNATPEASTLHPWPYFTLNPCIPHLMEAYSGQPR